LALLNPLIQRLKNSRIHGGDDIYRRIQFFLGHARFPCVRKAPFHSGITEPHHRHGKTNEHFLAVGETFHGMSITIKGTKISALQNAALLSDSTPVSGLESGKIPLYPPFKRGMKGGFTRNLNPTPETSLPNPV
jgi:hypothetical protein